jgi:dTDP-4-amino-4,6-dideoxygalactose transaminase
MSEFIPFNKPFLSGKENDYILEAVLSGKISGDGIFTKNCHNFFEKKYRFKKCLLTTSCTDALEMAAILLDIQAGDEIIMPSYTFVSTANAFVLRGAKIVFVDSTSENPNIDVLKIEKLITPNTKAIVVVHYAGIACEMEKIMQLSKQYNLFVVEDAAQAIDSYYKDKPLGSMGHLSAFSFHETKNVISGEGGMLVINDDRFIGRAEIIREKGTNRSAFFRGEIDKYGWVDIGSSFLPSDIIAAFLFAQLESLENIQKRRKEIWMQYKNGLAQLESNRNLKLPVLPGFATNNAHMFYIVCNNSKDRKGLIAYLKQNNVMAVFHYLSLHKSKFYQHKHDFRDLPWSDYYSDCLIRLPMFYELKNDEIKSIIQYIYQYYELSYND